MGTRLFQIQPKKHSCGTTLKERTVPVNSKILGWEKGYPVDYCPKCKIYKLNDKYESENPEIIGDIITEAQAQTNLKNHNSIYRKPYLEEIERKLKKF